MRLTVPLVLLLSLCICSRAAGDESIFDTTKPGKKAKPRKRVPATNDLFDTAKPRKKSARKKKGAESEETEQQEEQSEKKSKKTIQVSVRGGFAIPLHEMKKGIPIEDGVGLSVPLIVDIGARLYPSLYVGGYGRVAPGASGDRFRERCRAENGTCLTLNIALGGAVHYYPLPNASASPWVGFGLGVSAAFVGAWTEASNYTMQAIALDFAVVTAGLDFLLKPKLAIGPFVEGCGRTYVLHQQQGRFTPLPKKGDLSIAVEITTGLRLVVLP